MDTSVFFTYPTADKPTTGLSSVTAEDWDALLGATEALRVHPGDVVLRAGERDRALYLVLDGRVAGVSAPAMLGVVAFLDGLPQPETLRAETHGELARLSWDAFEALSARDARLGRSILLGLARDLAARLRA
ncbi:MAG TPA: cyclic nucleotide-binding domain-containing protein [Solirubrobacteraceae bacterium]|nr:cyclic nucleotide-binding domain-containing protein [Solirubrobacteraceae bacterium]